MNDLSIEEELGITRELFTDAIRYSILMITNSYHSLKELLLRISEMEKPDKDIIASILVCAWSIIDCTHRLRIILQSTPGVSQKLPAVSNFLNNVEKVSDFRHFIQHANTATEVKALINNERPFWGYLCWMKFIDKLHANAYSLKPGTLLKKK